MSLSNISFNNVLHRKGKNRRFCSDSSHNRHFKLTSSQFDMNMERVTLSCDETRLC